ncbi:MAG: YihA family ribosome biogenesis GTP-binding protein [Firmicutes bacterium]|nr:YihA family ribosome biogenesis GTP-binding protein [Bacillota bacterium]
MKITRVEFLCSAVKKGQYPAEDLPEIGFAGRSNVGKSSLINLLTNNRNAAKVSSSPGKTRTINFFLINGSFRIVDLPGYGYAKVSKSVSQDWGRMMEEYLSARPNLKKVIQLVDIRHEPTAQDVQMYDYLRYYGLSGIVVATKADKVSRNEQGKALSLIAKTLNTGESDVIIPVSALKKTGQDRLLGCMESLLQ